MREEHLLISLSLGLRHNLNDPGGYLGDAQSIILQVPLASRAASLRDRDPVNMQNNVEMQVGYGRLGRDMLQ